MSQYLRVRELARRMRRYPTPAEEYFWNHVRDRQLNGLKFNRQQIIACPMDNASTKFYIADFYCAEWKLIVELDGQIHEELYEHDIIRTDQMQTKGYRVIRFKNEEVLENWTSVYQSLVLLFGSQVPKDRIIK